MPSSSSVVLRPLSAAAQGAAYLLTHRSWTSRIGTGFRKWSFSRPRRCGIGTMVATGLEEDAARRGARAIRSSVLEADSAGRRLLESLGYVAVRVFREMRIALDAPPPAPEWPDGLRVVAFDPEHDALDFHTAHQEAFAEHWGHTPRD